MNTVLNVQTELSLAFGEHVTHVPLHNDLLPTSLVKDSPPTHGLSIVRDVFIFIGPWEMKHYQAWEERYNPYHTLFISLDDGYINEMNAVINTLKGIVS